jgi:hypothetical protein
MKQILLYALILTALSACATTAPEAARNPYTFKEGKHQVTFDVPFNLAFGVTPEKLEISEASRERFDPPGGSMDVDKEDIGISFAFGFQPEYRQYVGRGWIVGAFAKYQLYYPGWFDEYVKMATIDWWDPVTIQAIALRRSPSPGLLIAKNILYRQQFRLQLTPFYYSLSRLHFRGVDRPNERNISTVYRKVILDRGLGLGIELDFRPSWTDENLGRFSLHWDHAWSAWSFGFGWCITLPLYKSESIIPDTE